MRKFRTKFILTLVVVVLMGCNNNMNTKESLLAIDREFSNYSQENGMNAAFMEYISEDGVMLRANSMPIVGKNAVGSLFSGDDSGFTLTWEPMYADIAKSGEFGYTYGTYELALENGVQKGTYVSIWKKDTDGNWKFVLDSGNAGLGE